MSTRTDNIQAYNRAGEALRTPPCGKHENRFRGQLHRGLSNELNDYFEKVRDVFPRHIKNAPDVDFVIKNGDDGVEVTARAGRRREETISLSPSEELGEEGLALIQKAKDIWNGHRFCFSSRDPRRRSSLGHSHHVHDLTHPTSPTRGHRTDRGTSREASPARSEDSRHSDPLHRHGHPNLSSTRDNGYNSDDPVARSHRRTERPSETEQPDDLYSQDDPLEEEGEDAGNNPDQATPRFPQSPFFYNGNPLDEYPEDEHPDAGTQRRRQRTERGNETPQPRQTPSFQRTPYPVRSTPVHPSTGLDLNDNADDLSSLASDVDGVAQEDFLNPSKRHRLFLRAYRLEQEADDLIDNHNLGKPQAHDALDLARRIRKCLAHLNRLRQLEGDSNHLTGTIDRLGLRLEAVEGIQASQAELAEFDEIFRAFAPLINGDEQDPRAFTAAYEQIVHSFGGSQSRLLNRLLASTGNYLFRLHPNSQYRGRDLFNLCSNNDRRLALKFALMRQFSTYMRLMNRTTCPVLAELFLDLLSDPDRRNILRTHYVPGTDYQEALLDFFAVDPRKNNEKSDAILYWMDSFISTRLGRTIDNQLKAEIDLFVRVQALESENARLRAQHHQAVAQARSLTEQIEQARAAEVFADPQDPSSLEAFMEAQGAALEALMKERQQQDDRIAQLLQQLAQARSENTDKAQTAGALETDVMQLIAELRAELAAKEATIQQQARTIRRLERGLDRNFGIGRTRFDTLDTVEGVGGSYHSENPGISEAGYQQLRRLLSELAGLRRSLAAEEQRNAELTAALAAQQGDDDGHDATLASVARSRNYLRQADAMLENSQQLNDENGQLREQEEQEFASLNALFQAERARALRAEALVRKLQVLLAQARTGNGALAAMQEASAQTQSLTAQLTQQMETMRQGYAETAEQREAFIQQLEAERDDALMYAATLEAALHEKDALIARLRRLLATSDHARIAALRALDDQTAELLSLRKEVASLRQRVAPIPQPEPPQPPPGPRTQTPEPAQDRAPAAQDLALAPGIQPQHPAAEQGNFLDRVPQQILEGYIDPLVLQVNREVAEVVLGALQEILVENKYQPSPQLDNDVLHLAIYLANYFHNDLRQNADVFGALVQFVMNKSTQDLPAADRVKFETLAIALAEPGKICGPIHGAREEGRALVEMSAQAGRTPSSRRAWAQNLLVTDEDELSAPQKAVRAHLLHALTDAADVPDLQLFHNKVGTKCNLAQQLLSAIDPAHPENHLRVYSNLSSNRKQHSADNSNATVTVWLQTFRTREARIDQIIQESLSVAVPSEHLLAAPDLNLPQSNESVLDLLDRVKGLRRGRPSEEDRHIRDDELFRTLPTHLYQQILKLLCDYTGLQAANAQTCVDNLAQTVVETGDLPPLFKKIFSRENPNVVLEIAKELFDYVALSTRPKQGYEDIALHDSYNWLIQGRPPLEAASLLFKLMQECHNSPKFRSPDMPFAFAMTRRQAQWIQNIYRHMRNGNGDPIYAEAEAGKTSSAELAVRFCRQIPECNRPVFFLSPFADRGTIQFPKTAGDITITVRSEQDLNGVVIVDEGHLLGPNSRVILQHNQRQVVAPVLQMTATPVVPKSEYAAYKRGQMAPKYAEKLRALETQLQQVDEQVETALQQLHGQQIADTCRAIRASMPNCSTYLPNAQHFNYGQLEHALKEALVNIEAGNANGIDLQRLEAFRDKISHLFPARWTDNDTYHVKGGAVKKRAEGKRILGQTKDLINTLLGLLQGARNDAALLPRVQRELVQRRDYLGRQFNELRRKVQKWHEADDPDAVQYEEVRRSKAERFQAITYHRSNLIAETQAGIDFAAAQMATAQAPVLQAIFPGLRFHADNFDAFVGALRTAYCERSGYKGPISFVFQDSHSRDENRGIKRVYVFDARGLLTTTTLEEWSRTHNPANERTVLLYDETNMQGGDVGALSFAGSPRRDEQGHQIEQFLFFNIAEQPAPQTAAQDRSLTLTENDLLQALRRCRGRSTRPFHVYATQESADAFRARARANQRALEQGWALRTATDKITRKTVKARAQLQLQPIDQSAVATRASTSLRGMRGDQTFTNATGQEQMFSQVMAPQLRPDQWPAEKNRDEIEYFARWYATMPNAQ